jgi:hypothetical protein
MDSTDAILGCPALGPGIGKALSRQANGGSEPSRAAGTEDCRYPPGESAQRSEKRSAQGCELRSLDRYEADGCVSLIGHPLGASTHAADPIIEYSAQWSPRFRLATCPPTSGDLLFNKIHCKKCQIPAADRSWSHCTFARLAFADHVHGLVTGQLGASSATKSGNVDSRRPTTGQIRACSIVSRVKPQRCSH